MNKIFLYKDNSEDRDCCAYIDAEPMRFECDHYFGGVSLQGACYSGGVFANYEDIKTVLTEEEYGQLLQFAIDIKDLGYGIVKGDERYDKGVELCKAIQPVYDKLLSEEGQEFFEHIQDEEREYLMDEYNLDEEEVEQIFNEYGLDYRDRGVVSHVFSDTYDCGYEEAWSFGIIDSSMESGGFPYSRYFDFEKFGEDIAEDGYHCLLDDGRVVCLNY